MAAISSIIAVGGLAVGAAGAYTANKNAKAAAAQQREAMEFQSKQANLQNARAKRDAVRSARLAYGQSQQAGANQGVSDSSSSMGGLASIGSQAADNVSFLDQYGFFSDQASKALGRANAYQAKANTASSVAGLGMSVLNNANSIANVFGAK